MTFLPIVIRELQVRSRKRATYWTRFAVALAWLLVCLPQLLGAGVGVAPASVGRSVFNGTITAAFLLSCFASLPASNAIYSERRDGTLGLLFLTRVRALDVLLGKFASVGISMFCLVVAVLPLLALPLLAGGVMVGEAFRKWLAVMAALFLAVAVGLDASSVHQLRTRAWLRAVLVMILVLFLPAILSRFHQGGAPGLRTSWLALPSPLMTLLFGSDIAYRSAASPYWLSLAAVGSVSALLLWHAKSRLVRSLRQGPVAVPPVVDRPSLPLAPPWLAPGESSDPIERLVLGQRGLRVAMWTAALLTALFQTGMVPFYAWGMIPFGRPWWILAQVPFMAVSLITGALFAWAASRFFVEARSTGELELLRTTPQGAASIVSGQWQALKRMLRWPVVLVVAPVLLRVWLMVQSQLSGPSRLQPVYGLAFYTVLTLLLGAATTVFGIAALGWLGICFGLRARGQAGAIIWTVGLAKGIPYLISLLCATVLVPVTSLFRGNSSGRYGSLSWLPTVMIIASYLWLIRWAKRSLNAELAGANQEAFVPRGLRGGITGGLAAAIRKARHWTPS